MSEPTVPAPVSAVERPAEAVLPAYPTDPDLPDELFPLHEEFGDWWRIGYEPMCCRAAPYIARPRFGGGRTVRADTVRLLGRVLALATPDEDEPDLDTRE